MTTQSDDYDSPWKNILEKYFQDFLTFFFPTVAEGIDWERNHTFLDKELQQVTRDAELGKRLADKLVQVWRKDGEEVWVLVHVEIQGQEETAFPKRMYVYNYRIFDRYDRPVVSLAVLADERAAWRPDHYGYELWGCRVGIKFPMVKLLDYQDRWEELEASHNLFALAVMGHLKTMETRDDENDRRRWKLYLARKLYERGYNRNNVINFFHFIDWMMRLPDEMEEMFWTEIQAYEEEKNMPYVSSVEKIGIKKGIQQGIQQGKREGVLEAIELGLTIKFGINGLRLLPAVRAIENMDRLEMIKEAIKATDKLDEIKAILEG